MRRMANGQSSMSGPALKNCLLSRKSVTTDIVNRGGVASFVKMNVTSKEDWEAVLKFAKATFDGLDILVNNAGWTYRIKDTVTVTEQEFDSMPKTLCANRFDLRQ